MRLFKEIFVYVLCIFSFKIEKTTAGPTEITGKYLNLGPTDQNEWKSIVSSIESRLKNLDNLYTSQLTPTLETRLEHFQNRISGMEVKLLRIEALLTTKLDRMSDNISSRHFRDDMVQTDLFRKIETAYDGITHRLAYMDRKSDNDILKIQAKVETISKKLENMDDALTTKHDSIESELSDYVAGVDDLKSFFRNAEEKLMISLEKHSNVTLKKQNEMQEFSKKNILTELANTMFSINQNVTKNLENLKQKINIQNSINNNTEKSIQKLSNDLGIILNEYASKVSDLGEQVSKSDNKIATHLNTIEIVTNSTKVETQNGIRALMVQVGKITNKEQNRYEDQRFLADMGETLNSNFEKIITTQNSFLESCHRVQMDESQMETQISDILNKLIDNFAKTSREQHHFLKKIDGLLVKHDVHARREMHQVNENLQSIFEKNKNDSKTLDVHLRKTGDNLEALFALVQNNLGHSNVKRGLYLGRHNDFGRAMEEQKEILYSYRELMQNSANFIESKIVENNEIFRNITENIEYLKSELDSNTTKTILESVTKTNTLIHKNTESLGVIMNTVQALTKVAENETKSTPEGRSLRTNSTNSTSNIDELIREVFFVVNGTNELDTKTSSNSSEKNESDCLDFDIDVRFEDQNNSTRRSFKKCEGKKTTPTTEKYTDGILFPIDEEITKDHSVELPIDVRFDEITNPDDELKTNRSEHQIMPKKMLPKSNGSVENTKQDEITTEIDNSTQNLDLNVFI